MCALSHLYTLLFTYSSYKKYRITCLYDISNSEYSDEFIGLTMMPVVFYFFAYTFHSRKNT